MKNLRRTFLQKYKIGYILLVVLFFATTILILCHFLKNTESPYETLPLSRYAKAHQTGPYLAYNSLAEVEAASDIIVEAIVSEVTGPTEAKYYSADFYSTMPFGHTEKDIKITKVYQGDVKKGDILTLKEAYYF